MVDLLVMWSHEGGVLRPYVLPRFWVQLGTGTAFEILYTAILMMPCVG